MSASAQNFAYVVEQKGEKKKEPSLSAEEMKKIRQEAAPYLKKLHERRA